MASGGGYPVGMTLSDGRPDDVVVSVDDRASLEETLDVMGRPGLIAQIRDSLAELAADEGDVLTEDAARNLLRD